MRGGGDDTGPMGPSGTGAALSSPGAQSARLALVWGRKTCCRLVALSGNNNSKPECGHLTFTRLAGL